MYIISMRKRNLYFIAAIAALLLFSCTDFFSTSWAPWAARDPDKLVPAVTAGNVDELIALAENDPNLSLAILKKIRSAANGASEEDRQKLQCAALEAAVNAAGLGQAVLGVADKLISIDNEDDAKKLVFDTINVMSNLEAAGSVLFDILPPAPNLTDPTDENWPAFKAFTDSASADSLAMAAVVIIAGEAKKISDGDFDSYFDSYFDNPYEEEYENEKLAIALAFASALEGRENELSGPLRNVLQGLNLISSLSPSP